MSIDPYETYCFGVEVGEDEGDRAFPWPNPDSDEKDFDMDLTEWVVFKETGKRRPWALPDSEYGQLSEVERHQMHEDYKVEREKLGELPVEIVNFGSSEYRRQIIAITGTVQRTSEYGCRKVDAHPINGEKLHVAREFCKKYDLHPFDDPAWLVAAQYA